MKFNPRPWNDPEDYVPTNKFQLAVGGAVALPKEKLTPVVIKQFYYDMLYDKEYWSGWLNSEDPDHREEAIESNKHRIDKLIEKDAVAVIIKDPIFKRGSSQTTRVHVEFHHPADFLRFNYEPTRLDTISFKIQNHEFNLYKKEQVYWFINFMKKVFLYLDAEYGWADHFDYLYQHRNDDARQYVFGLVFYGKEMVTKIGREKLLSAPAYKMEELENNSIMLQFHEHPFSKIPEKERRPILKYLGIKQPPKAKTPKWLKKRAPKAIKLEKEAKVKLVVGVNSSDVVFEGMSQNLFDFYCETIHHKLKNAEDIPNAIGFKTWFNGLDTGLEAFVSGSDESGDDEFEAFIGQPINNPLDIFSTDGKFSSVHELDIATIEPVFGTVKEKFTNLCINKEPQFHILLYISQGEIE